MIRGLDGNILVKEVVKSNDGFLLHITKLPIDLIMSRAELLLENFYKLNPDQRVEAEKVLSAIRQEYCRRKQTPIEEVKWFAWPKIEGLPNVTSESINRVNWADQGVLGLAGYTVNSIRNLRRHDRHRLLSEVFFYRIPASVPIEYAALWGRPVSAVRLQKMATSMSSFHRLATGRSADMNTALARWKADLAWLKRTYYDGFFSFDWPSASELFR